MRNIVITKGVRTAIENWRKGKDGSGAIELGSAVIRASLERIGMDANQVDYILMGNALQAGLGQNPARQAARGGGYHSMFRQRR